MTLNLVRISFNLLTFQLSIKRLTDKFYFNFTPIFKRAYKKVIRYCISISIITSSFADLEKNLVILLCELNLFKLSRGRERGGGMTPIPVDLRMLTQSMHRAYINILNL